MNELLVNTTLITGATGFIGGHLAKRLVNERWKVKLLVRDGTKLSDDLQDAAKVIIGDLSDEVALEQAVSDVSVIFHCAANVKTWDKTSAYHTANVLGVQNLLNAIAKYNPSLTRLVHISTTDVYGFPEKPCDEKSPTLETGFGYSDSKLRGENLVREYCACQNIHYTIIRPTNVIGYKSQFIQRIGSELQSGLMLTIDKGQANAGFVYIDNLIDYLLWAARTKHAAFQCYNVRDNYDVSWAEFIESLRGLLNGRGLVLDLPFGIANGLAISVEKFYQLFLPRHEPILHRLLVHIFGRTCGHSAEKIRSDSGIVGKVGFEEAMRKSLSHTQCV